MQRLVFETWIPDTDSPEGTVQAVSQHLVSPAKLLSKKDLEALVVEDIVQRIWPPRKAKHD